MVLADGFVEHIVSVIKNPQTKEGIDVVGLCGKQGWTYTRYADDLTFSASGEPSHKVGFFLARVRHLVADEGFAVNEAKTRVLRSGSAQLVTGIVVNQHPNLPRRQLRRLRAILHHAKSEGLEAQNRQSHPFFQGYVRGMIAYVSMVNPQRGAQLKQAFESLP